MARAWVYAAVALLGCEKHVTTEPRAESMLHEVSSVALRGGTAPDDGQWSSISSARSHHRDGSTQPAASPAAQGGGLL